MKQKVTIIGVILLALVLSSTACLALGTLVEKPLGSYTQGERPGTYDEIYRGRSSYQQSQRHSQQQRDYQSQYYRPRTLSRPPVKIKSPVELLEDSINKVIKFLSRSEPANMDQMLFFLNKEITPHFDFDYMSRWVAGRNYRAMSPEQQLKFNESFTELFVTTFVQKLSNYQNYPPVVGGFRSRRTSDNEAMATANILQENGGKLQVDFKFLKTPKGWKVIDVRANGVSALLYYRNYFAQQNRSREQRRVIFN